MNNTRLIHCALWAAIVIAAGCAAPQPAQDPLAGWKSVGGYNPLLAASMKRRIGTTNALGRINTTTPAEYESCAKECPFGAVVVEDYQSFIKKQKSDWVQQFEYFEDGKGQHAVKITAGKNGTYKAHILIYDSSNRRTRIISYTTGHYRC